MPILKFLLFTVLIFSTILVVRGQTHENDESNLRLPEEFLFHGASRIKIVTSLDSIKGRVFDSIQNPKAWFIDTYVSGNGYSWCIAIEKNDSLLVFNPFENSNAYCETSGIRFSRKNFDSKGNDELIIEWEKYLGHTGWESAIHERSGGIMIWDLDKLRRYLDFENLYSLQSWWQEYEPDPTNKLQYEKRKVINSGGENHLEKYNVSIEPGYFIIEKDTTKPEDEIKDSTEKHSGGEPLSLLYLMGENKMVRVKNNTEKEIPWSARQALIVFREGDLSGLINRNGTVLIPAVFHEIYQIMLDSEPYWRIGTVDFRYALFNKDLNPVIPFEYDNLQPLDETLIRVLKNSRYGLLNFRGETLLPSIYNSISDFVGNFAIIRTDSLNGIIDKQGKIIVQPEFTHVDVFSEGLMAVKKGRKFGYINEQGEMVIAPDFDEAHEFGKGLAIVRKEGDPQGRTYGLINKNGEWIIKPQYSLIIRNYTTGYYIARMNNAESLIDPEGKMVISYFDCVKVACGLGKNKDLVSVHLWEYQMHKHRLFLSWEKKQLSVEHYFWQLRNLRGDTIIQDQFDEIGQYAGTVYLRKGKFWRWYDEDTRRIRKLAEPGSDYFIFSAGMQKPGIGVVNKKGKVIIPFEFEGIEIKNGQIIGWKSGLPVFYNLKGKLLKNP